MKNNNPETRLKDLELEMNAELEGSIKREMLFRQAIENSLPSGIAVIDETGKQVYVNQSFCKMFGWEKDELLDKHPPYKYWPKDNLEPIMEALQKTLNNEATKEGFDLEFCHKNGDLIHVNVVVSPFMQENDKPHFLANVIDISGRKKDEEELKRSQLLLMSSIESQKDTIIFSLDLNYHYLYFNKAHADAMKFAYNSDVKTGESFLDCVTKDADRKSLKENIDRSLRGESISIIQLFGKNNIDYYEVFFNPIVDEKNGIIGCASLAKNISERKQAEKTVRDSETKFKEIINQIYDGIIVFDEQEKIVIWNNGAEQISELNAEDTLNKSIVDIQYQLLPPVIRDKAAIEKAITGFVTQQTPDRFNQIIDSEIITSKSKNLRNIQSIVFPISLEGYHLFCTVIRDSTEIKRYEKELLRISAEKDKFYSTIAQYLYNPFNVFQSYTKLMVEELDSLSIKEIQRMVVEMSKSATNLYSLLDNMLQWTKMNQGKIAFSPQILNFNNTCHDAISILKPIADSKNITINFLSPQDISVFADIYMLKTIIRNLVTNAIKFTGTDGHIDISAVKTPSDVTISVRDNGTGITSDYIAKLFDLSHINTAMGEAEEKGTTLGLFLCKEFVEKSGGKIWAESVKGKGCEFKFTLPVFSEK